jgi:hypothetical protein
MVDMEVVTEMAQTWQREGSVRDPRDLDVARRRAFGLPDDARSVELGRVMSETPITMQVIAMCEAEYQNLVSTRPRVLDDVVSGWILSAGRDRERVGSLEWWAYDRLRWRYLEAVALGALPRPVTLESWLSAVQAEAERCAPSAPRRRRTWLPRWLYGKRG